MGRLAVCAAILIVLAATPRLADAAGCTTCSEGLPGHNADDDGSLGPGHSGFLIWGLTVNTLFTAFDGYQLARFRDRNPKVTGLQLVMAVPVAVYGIQFIKLDSHDWAAWGVTLWSTGLIAHAMVPFIAAKFHEQDDTADPSKAVLVTPTMLLSMDDRDRKPYAGLAVAGRF